MSGTEALVIEVAFGAATGMMLVAAAARGLMARRREGPMVMRGRLDPPGLVPIDLLGVMMLAGVYFGFHWLSLQPLPDGQDGGITAGGLILSILSQLMILAMVLATMIPRCRLAEFFGLRWSSWPWVVLIAPVTVVGVWILIGLLEVTGYSEWMADWFDGPQLQDSVALLRETVDPAVLALMAVAAVLVAPVCEECVFRGYIYPVIKKFGGPGTAAVASSLLFAAAHNHVPTLVPLFMLGLVLVWVYEVTGSIWAPVAVHLCFNGLTVGLTLMARLMGASMEVVP